MQAWPCVQRLSCAQVARRAGQVGAQHRVVAPVGPGPDRIGRAEDARPPAGRARPPRCIGPESLVTQIVPRRMSAASSASVVSPARLMAPGASSATSAQTRVLAVRADQNHGEFLFQKMPRHLGEAVAPPLFGFPIGARRHDDESWLWRSRNSPAKRRCGCVASGGIGNEKSARLVVEAEHRRRSAR